MSVLERFLSKIQKTDGCWLWVGAVQNRAKPYGRIKVNGKPDGAHRVSFTLFKGPITDGLWVLHTCDNPRCVNPDHLFLGDRSDNMRDCAKKRRLAHNLPRHTGEQASRNRKLTKEQVVGIRLAEGTAREIGKANGVSHVTVLRVKSRKSYAWLQD